MVRRESPRSVQQASDQFLVGETIRGKVFIIRGTGSSWDAAFEDALRTYPQLRRRVTSTRSSSKA